MITFIEIVLLPFACYNCNTLNPYQYQPQNTHGRRTGKEGYPPCRMPCLIPRPLYRLVHHRCPPAIAAQFNADAVTLGWITSAYIVSAALFIVPFGRLADIFGRKKIFVLGVLIFTVASLASALAPVCRFPDCGHGSSRESGVQCSLPHQLLW